MPFVFYNRQFFSMSLISVSKCWRRLSSQVCQENDTTSGNGNLKLNETLKRTMKRVYCFLRAIESKIQWRSWWLTLFVNRLYSQCTHENAQRIQRFYVVCHHSFQSFLVTAPAFTAMGGVGFITVGQRWLCIIVIPWDHLQKSSISCRHGNLDKERHTLSLMIMISWHRDLSCLSGNFDTKILQKHT